MDGVDLMDVTRVLVMSVDIKRITLVPMNVKQLAYKNHHVLVMPYLQTDIPIQIDVSFMETFRRQILFLDGNFGKNHILYQQNPMV